MVGCVGDWILYYYSWQSPCRNSVVVQDGGIECKQCLVLIMSLVLWNDHGHGIEIDFIGTAEAFNWDWATTSGRRLGPPCTMSFLHVVFPS